MLRFHRIRRRQRYRYRERDDFWWYEDLKWKNPSQQFSVPAERDRPQPIQPYDPATPLHPPLQSYYHHAP